MTETTSHTYHLGLIGYPLGHSLSPLLHENALQQAHLSGTYSLFAIEPGPHRESRIKGMLELIRGGAMDGLNVTIPFKQIVIPFLDELSPLARATKAVNTIYLRNGQIIGDNTDISGFEYDLDHFIGLKSSSPRSVLVLGAGGAARAITYALARNNWQVTLASRKVDQALQLIDDIATSLPSLDLRVIDLNAIQLENMVKSYNLVVNTTPVGMAPEIAASPWPSGHTLPGQSAIYDVIYNPQETLFLKQARLEGLAMRNGLGMLLAQAAFAFHLWTGFEVQPYSLQKALPASFGLA